MIYDIHKSSISGPSNYQDKSNTCSQSELTNSYYTITGTSGMAANIVYGDTVTGYHQIYDKFHTDGAPKLSFLLNKRKP